MSRSGVAVCSLLVVAAAGVPCAAQTPQAPSESVIVAQGEASVTSAPDRAFLQIAAEGRAQKPADAQKVAADAMASVQAALKRLNLPADAIRTTAYELQPEFDYNNGRQTLRDYLARNQIEVRVDELARLSEVIDASGASGAASMSGLRFDVKNRDVIERDALKRAVQDAMGRAQAMAAGANRTVGSIIRIEEERVSAPTPVRYTMTMTAAAADRTATPVAPGEIEIRAHVTLTVGIR